MSYPFEVVFPGDVPHITRVTAKLPQPVAVDARNIELKSLYFPAVNDVVLGVVTFKTHEGYKIYIGADKLCLLKIHNFPRATLQHHPRFEPGAVVLCGIVDCDQFLPLQLSCNVKFENKSWETKETYLGEMTDGLLEYIGVQEAAVLSADNCALLYLIGTYLPFEIAVGLNGFIYVKAEKITTAHKIIETLKAGLKFYSFNELEAFVKLAVAQTISVD